MTSVLSAPSALDLLGWNPARRRGEMMRQSKLPAMGFFARRRRNMAATR